MNIQISDIIGDWMPPPISETASDPYFLCVYATVGVLVLALIGASVFARVKDWLARRSWRR